MMKRILEGCILKETRRLPSCRNCLCAQYRHSPFSISPKLMKSVLREMIDLDDFCILKSRVDEETISKIQHHLHIQEYLKDSHSAGGKRGNGTENFYHRWVRPESDCTPGDPQPPWSCILSFWGTSTPRVPVILRVWLCHTGGVFWAEGGWHGTTSPCHIPGCSTGHYCREPVQQERGSASPRGAGQLLLGIFCHVTATAKFTIKVLLFLYYKTKDVL